jgi:hypothetical protein
VSGVDLVTFLRARLDEDERVARAVPSGFDLFDGTGIIVMPANTGTRIVTLPSSVAAFAVRHDPARVLRDVAAKRRIVERAEQYQRWAQNEDTPAFKALATAGDLMVRFLAAPFATHPDFDPAWAVEGTVTT